MRPFALEFSLICLAFNVVQGESPVVDTLLGKVRGIVLNSVHDRPLYSFRGIPYAKPPIKELRFKPPVPIEPWEDVHDATEDGHRCLQYDFLRNGLITGDEDCLFLNIYSQQLPPTTLRPVMVFIHGGAFSAGDGLSDLYGPERLLDRDVVLVTINYRLSALGFLSTGDSVSPGNYGLLDQVEALKWIRDNVAAFGGDPLSVTLFGQSAGGSSAVFHILSPLSKGLFHAAIPQSGTYNNPWAIQSLALSTNFTKRLAQVLNCPTDSSELIVQCLRRRAALDIAIKSSPYQSVISKSNSPDQIVFLPIVDEGLGGVEFLPRTPQQLLHIGQINKVPVMIGTCKDEGFILFELFSAKCGGLENFHIEDILAGFMDGPLPYQNPDATIVKQHIAEYLSVIESTDSLANITVASNLIGDAFFVQGIDETISAFAINDLPTYAYKITQNLNHSLAHLFVNKAADAAYIEKLKIVSHGDDLQYLFNISSLTSLELKMSDVILTLWTNFAKNKAPSLEGAKDFREVQLEWTRVQSNSTTYLDLNLAPSMKTGFFASKPDLWKMDNRG